jgi:hypothetical protein
LECYRWDPGTGGESRRETIFSKRFVSNSLKRSFSEECCAPSFVSKLTPRERRSLDDFVENNQPLYQKFQSYKPKPIDAVFNARVRRLAEQSGKIDFQALVVALRI